MAAGYISMDAPLAKTLMGKALDSEIRLNIAGVEKRYAIVKIEYE
jgi:transcription elongation GreA/GreB family factor